jgi:hypothetical protein
MGGPPTEDRMIRINTNQQEVEYKGLFFQFERLKTVVRKVVPEELLREHCIHKRFNSSTGQIERKYAFDAVFEDLANIGVLQAILDDIIEEEYLN